MKKICIVGASGKLGQYMVQHALDRGYEVVGVCRERSVDKLNKFKGRLTIIPGATNDRDVIRKAVAGCVVCLCKYLWLDRRIVSRGRIRRPGRSVQADICQ